MRTLPLLVAAIILTGPQAARSQSIELYGSAGPTLIDAGNSVAAGIAFSPTSRLSILGSVERTHLASQTRRDGNVVSNFRGGTFYVGSAEVRFTPLDHGRVRPFALGGFAAGVSKPNVTAVFPTPVTNDVRALFAGGGVSVPLGARVNLFADARMMFGAEGAEGIVAVAPLRAGIAWRF